MISEIIKIKTMEFVLFNFIHDFRATFFEYWNQNGKKECRILDNNKHPQFQRYE